MKFSKFFIIIVTYRVEYNVIYDLRLKLLFKNNNFHIKIRSRGERDMDAFLKFSLKNICNMYIKILLVWIEITKKIHSIQF